MTNRGFYRPSPCNVSCDGTGGRGATLAGERASPRLAS
jgi:hypothetical protein